MHHPYESFAGSVEASDDPRYKPGDKVVLVAGTGLSTTRHNQIVVHQIE